MKLSGPTLTPMALLAGLLLVAGTPGLAGNQSVTPTKSQDKSPPAPSKQFRYEQKLMADEPTGPAPLKKRIAVARIGDSLAVADSPFGEIAADLVIQMLDEGTEGAPTGNTNAPMLKRQDDDKTTSVLPSEVRQELITALFATDRFVLLERQDIHKILREQDFSSTTRVNAKDKMALGKLIPVQFMITGFMSRDLGEGSDHTSDSDIGTMLAIPGSDRLIGISGKKVRKDPGATEDVDFGTGPTMGDKALFDDPEFECHRANPTRRVRLALHLRVYDVSTSQIVSAIRVSADSPWCLVKAGVQRIIKQMDKFPWKTRVLSVENGSVVLEGGEDVNMTYEHRIRHTMPPGRRMAEGGRFRTSELQIVEISHGSTLAQPMKSGRLPDIRPGDWVVEKSVGAN